MFKTTPFGMINTNYFNSNNNGIGINNSRPYESFHCLDSYSDNILDTSNLNTGYKYDRFTNNIVSPNRINSGYKVDYFTGLVRDNQGITTGIKLDPITNQFNKLY